MTKANLLSYLHAHTIFSSLSPEQLERLSEHVGESQFAAGELVFRQGEPAANFYIVQDGSIKVEVPSINGPALVVQTLGADEVLGWSWLIPPYQWTFEAKAQQDSRMLTFDGKAILQHCEDDSAFGYALMKIFASLMSRRLHAARLKMMESWAPPGWA